MPYRECSSGCRQEMPSLFARGVWWCRGWLSWYLRDRWVLKREGWRKGPDGWWEMPDA
jgi:hypothetical protein